MSNWRRATRDDYAVVNRLLMPFDRKARPSDLDPLDPRLQVWVTDDGTAMFCLLFARDVGRWTGHLTSVSVAEEARGRGLSKEAYDIAEAEALRFARREQEAIRVFGYTNPERAASIHTLEKRGWERLSDGPGTSLWAFDVDGRKSDA